VPLRSQDRCVWIGDDAIIPIGSSGKVRSVSPSGKTCLVDWGSNHERVCQIGKEVITVRQAYNRKIEPWDHVFDKRPNRNRNRVGPGVSVDVLHVDAPPPLSEEGRLTPSRKAAGMRLI
jgi:hypothetical protein